MFERAPTNVCHGCSPVELSSRPSERELSAPLPHSSGEALSDKELGHQVLCIVKSLSLKDLVVEDQIENVELMGSKARLLAQVGSFFYFQFVSPLFL